MKKTWSRSWKQSAQPRKQRKYRINAPVHIKAKFLSAHLSKELRQKYGKRAIQVKNKDKVKIMRGTFKGRVGAVEKTDIKDSKIYISGIEITRMDGSKRKIGIDPSNVMITELDLKDKKRQQSLS